MPEYQTNSNEFDFSQQIKSDVASGKLSLSIRDSERLSTSSKLMSGLRDKSKGSCLTFNQLLSLFKNCARSHTHSKECPKMKMALARVNNFLDLVATAKERTQSNNDMKNQFDAIEEMSESQLARAEQELTEWGILNQDIEDLDELYLETYSRPASSDYLKEKL